MNKFIITLVLGIAFSVSCWSQMVQPVKDGPIHEALVTRVEGTLFIDAYPHQPPPPIRERIPAQTDEGTSWIRGYWSWMQDRDDYVWTTGVWRRPPPGHQWIEGFWEEFDDGWVWVQGFWSAVDEENLTYNEVQPPEILDEEVPSPPGEDYFWDYGFWWFDPQAKDYEWVEGEWEKLDPNWVLIPAHYVWRPEGYVFIPAYWDWPLDSLGQAYESVYIEPRYRTTIVFEPRTIITETTIIDHYFYYYPDYLCFYYHHFHYHPHFWVDFCCAPHWWLWSTWWGLSWHDHWGLWWWYSHPGFPQPLWLKANISQLLPPPPYALFNKMKKVAPPKFITPKGIVSPEKLLEEISNLTGEKEPILSEKEWGKVLDIVKPERVPEIIRPQGRPRPFDPSHKRPAPIKPIFDRDRIKPRPDVRLPTFPIIRPERKPRPGPSRDEFPLRPRPRPRPPTQVVPSRPRPRPVPPIDVIRPRPQTEVPSRPRPEYVPPRVELPSKPDRPNRPPIDVIRPRPQTDMPSRPRPEYVPPRVELPSKPDRPIRFQTPEIQIQNNNNVPSETETDKEEKERTRVRGKLPLLLPEGFHERSRGDY